ncbi:hypothetical protein GOHSU_24_00240 [Gordonia hirsuta DSM 44140 = NBRC 16056]|uniref:Uncharacterized protein n=1 Tax=Gordonia hirsuta DSM 44140 = NBRC 16056 TaxID=1121927 RepID=L7L9A9_9ACTN|nr:hypothetical protein GOHSU_24_00240 [Gordonia hirsuta DSM 44140 = NBRC 16056]
MRFYYPAPSAGGCEFTRAILSTSVDNIVDRSADVAVCDTLEPRALWMSAVEKPHRAGKRSVS